MSGNNHISGEVASQVRARAGGNYAPIALFIYRRPSHLKKTIESLQTCEEFWLSPIYVFADGAKDPTDIPAVLETRSVARELLGERAHYVVHDRNRGLAESIIQGVSDLCERFGKVIVVEDDLVVAPSFLRFLNGALDRYAHEPRVMQVSGHMFDVPELFGQSEALFLPMTTSWGWGTWKRAWDHFDVNANGWNECLADADWRKSFDLGGRYPYSRMLREQMKGEVDSWAIRWYFSVFNNSGLVLFPPWSLVQNHGMDGSGTHGRSRRRVFDGRSGPTMTFRYPDDFELSTATEAVLDASFRGVRNPFLKVISVAYSLVKLRSKHYVRLGYEG